MKTWEVVVKDLGTGERYLVTVETETNYRAAAKVRALDIVYGMPGMTWQANRAACTALSGRNAYAVRVRSGFVVVAGELPFEKHTVGHISSLTMRKLTEMGRIAFDRERQRWTLT